MKCIIIEDESGARDHLEKQLVLSGFDVEITARLDTVKSAITWLQQNTTELIFLDIQLGDGNSFEIFDNVSIETPVIFTTSYNQYAIKAFEVNAIAYLLKPVKRKELVQALEKNNQLHPVAPTINEKLIPVHQHYQERFLVQSGGRLLPIPVEEIVSFRVHDSRSLIITSTDKQQFLIDNKLEILESRLDPALFFRVNRQYILHIKSVKEILADENGKLRLILVVPTNEEIIVSRDKANIFKVWLTKEL
jgi:two-component system response regulator LytT